MNLRLIAAAYAVVLLLAGLTNYIPGITDAEGRAFGVFALDSFDDALHFASAAWAAFAAWVSGRAARTFLQAFGVLYLLDGLMGFAFGSGYLDLGILIHGIQDMPFTFKVLANLPHMALGGFAVAAGFLLPESRQTAAV